MTAPTPRAPAVHPMRGRIRWWGWLLMGVAVAGVVVGLVAGAYNLSERVRMIAAAVGGDPDRGELSGSWPISAGAPAEASLRWRETLSSQWKRDPDSGGGTMQLRDAHDRCVLVLGARQSPGLFMLTSDEDGTRASLNGFERGFTMAPDVGGAKTAATRGAWMSVDAGRAEFSGLRILWTSKQTKEDIESFAFVRLFSSSRISFSAVLDCPPSTFRSNPDLLAQTLSAIALAG
jgi:hypothetical protein